MDAVALTVAVAALAVAMIVLTAILAVLLRERAAQAAQRQSAQDLLEENLVHALAELTLRVDELTRRLDIQRAENVADSQ